MRLRTHSHELWKRHPLQWIVHPGLMRILIYPSPTLGWSLSTWVPRAYGARAQPDDQQAVRNSAILEFSPHRCPPRPQSADRFDTVDLILVAPNWAHVGPSVPPACRHNPVWRRIRGTSVPPGPGGRNRRKELRISRFEVRLFTGAPFDPKDFRSRFRLIPPLASQPAATGFATSPARLFSGIRPPCPTRHPPNARHRKHSRPSIARGQVPDRRIPFKDLLNFEAGRDRIRSEALDRLTDKVVASGLYFPQVKDPSKDEGCLQGGD